MRKNGNRGFPIFALGVVASLALSFGALLYLWKRKIVYFFIPLLIAVLAGFYLAIATSKKKSEEEEKLESEFIDFFSYFSIYVQDGFNVYKALEASLPYSKGELKARLQGLLSQIDQDKSLTPYLCFASKFSSIEIREVMLAIYQMVDQGPSGVYLQQFLRLFSNLADQKRDRAQNRYLEKLDTLDFLPLLGGGISMLTLMVALLEIMGGMLNGL